jgi:hypothetical protein
VNAVMNLRVPKNVGNFLTSYEPVSFSWRAMLRGESTELSWHRGLVMFVYWRHSTFNLDLNQGKSLLIRNSTRPPTPTRRNVSDTIHSATHRQLSTAAHLAFQTASVLLMSTAVSDCPFLLDRCLRPLLGTSTDFSKLNFGF